ncbi:MAG: hypothetical protein QXK45_05640 [Thermofilaceae archaeon]
MGREFESEVTERWIYEHGRMDCDNTMWDGFTLICLDNGEVLDEKPWAHIPNIGSMVLPTVDYYYAFSKFHRELGKVKNILKNYNIDVNDEEAYRIIKVIHDNGFRMFKSSIIMAWAVFKGFDMDEYKRLCKRIGVKCRLTDYRRIIDKI